MLAFLIGLRSKKTLFLFPVGNKIAISINLTVNLSLGGALMKSGGEVSINFVEPACARCKIKVNLYLARLIAALSNPVAFVATLCRDDRFVDKAIM